MATILIVGASRGIGLETVKAAIEAGHDVRAFSRSAADMPGNYARLHKIAGDARSRTDIKKALHGADVVVETLGVSSLHDVAFGTTLFSTATRELVAAMKTTGVKRLIAVTGAGAGNSRGHITPLYDYLLYPAFLQRLYRDKDIAEDIIMRSGLEWTIVRPVLLTNRPANGLYKALPDMKDWHGGITSRGNVADFLLNQIEDRSMIGETPLLVG